MNKSVLGVLTFLFAITANATVFTWDNESTDNEWTNPLNWVNNSGLPKVGDTVVFNNTQIGLCRVATNAHVLYLLITNTSGTVEFDIPPGYSLTASYRQCYDVNAANRVLMYGGGTFSPSGDVFVAQKTSSVGLITNQAELVLSNLVFETRTLNGLNVGGNSHANSSSSSVSGLVDLVWAAVQWRGNPNMLVASNGLVGSLGAYGALKLPNTLTNLTCGLDLTLGNSKPATTISAPSVMYFGSNSAFKTLAIGRTLRTGKGDFVFLQDGLTKTGLPFQADMVIGSPNAPGQLTLGNAYDVSFRTRLGEITAFRGWLSGLTICKLDNNAAGTCYAELDLSETSVSNLDGSITTQSLSIAEVSIGGPSGYPTGVLKLPSTLRSITCGSFDMGYLDGLNTPSNSVLHLGTNSLPIVFTVSNRFVLGGGQFLTVNAAGIASNAFPEGSKLRVGTPSARAVVQLGTLAANGTTGLFGKGFDDITLYASNVVLGRGGWVANIHYFTNDFRQATNFAWDVEGNFFIGTNLGDCMFAWFPPNGRAACSNLAIGQADQVSQNYRAFLHLSNTVLTVQNAATVKETGVITNFVDGYSSGLDIGSLQFDLQDPTNATGLYDYGRMDIRFLRDPVKVSEPYWGLRLKGDGTALLQTLTVTNATYPFRRLTWSTNALSATAAQRFGIHYDSIRNVTYVGVSPLAGGAMILVR